jgi:hypothetical protein
MDRVEENRINQLAALATSDGMVTEMRASERL